MFEIINWKKISERLARAKMNIVNEELKLNGNVSMPFEES